ncbi:hypothetical protein V2A60_010391 [Cordyceps javanica]
MTDVPRTPSEPRLSASLVDALGAGQLEQLAVTIVDSVDGIALLLDDMKNLPTSPPSLYLDLEGINLGREGSVSILQIHSLPKQHTYLVDVHCLGSKAFSTQGSDGSSIKSVLESSMIPKVFFDVRNDSDALYSHFSIHLRGVEDLQLMELATRSSRKRFVSGLAKCIELDAPLAAGEKQKLVECKKAGQLLFAPEKGGSYEVFNTRPLAGEIVRYCVNDVCILPRLWKHYNGKMGQKWRRKMLASSAKRVDLSHSPFFCGKGRHMAEGPPEW